MTPTPTPDGFEVRTKSGHLVAFGKSYERAKFLAEESNRLRNALKEFGIAVTVDERLEPGSIAINGRVLVVAPGLDARIADQAVGRVIPRLPPHSRLVSMIALGWAHAIS